MVLDGEKGSIYEVLVDRMRLEHVSWLKYLGCLLDESGIDVVKCHRKLLSERKVVKISAPWLMLVVCS